MVESEHSIEYDKGNSLINMLVNNKAIRVDRREFLFKLFKDHDCVNEICENGPIGIISEAKIKNIAIKLVDQTTLMSSSISLATGIPGGLVAFGTIPADIIQFYGMSTILAQKLMYLYGYPDMYSDDNLSENGRLSLIAFLGVMLGVSGANVVVKGISSSLAKHSLKKLPQKALTKTVYYPTIKKIVTILGGKLTKATFAKSVSKVIPVVGGVVSGAITLATLKPMGMRLQRTLHNDFFKLDEPEDLTKEELIIEKSAIEKLKEAKELLDLDILDQNEFLTIKNKYISEL